MKNLRYLWLTFMVVLMRFIKEAIAGCLLALMSCSILLVIILISGGVFWFITNSENYGESCVITFLMLSVGFISIEAATGFYKSFKSEYNRIKRNNI